MRSKIKKFINLDLKQIVPLIATTTPIIFLDTARPDRDNTASYLFINPVKELSTRDFEEIPDILNKIDQLTDKYWISGYVSYEAGYVLEKTFAEYRKNSIPSMPLVWFGVFEKPYIFDHLTGKWDRSLPECKTSDPLHSPSILHDIHEPTEKVTLSHTLCYEDYKRSIGKILLYIKSGDTYQVNFTFDMMLNSSSTPFELYQKLRTQQKTAYCSYINTSFGSIASLSPELFFALNKQRITCKPMKGTVSRGISIEQDKSLKQFLKNDPKNCAENIMIVDLLRNDLGRIALPGSVRVKKLFAIETHRTLHQMTSLITGSLDKECTFSTIFRNIFPCGSITGAPKIRTMQIIHSLETGARGVYCGMIGYHAPQKKAVFSVPIRTLQKALGQNSWQFRVGGGIVWDSTPDQEWEECLQKSKFLTYSQPDFSLVESLYFNGNNFLYKADHIQRMKNSADFFNYSFQENQLNQIFSKIASLYKGKGAHKVRVILNSDGVYDWECLQISPIELKRQKGNGEQSLYVLLEKKAIDAEELFLFHKTSYRPWFKSAEEKISEGNYYDVIFTNQRGEITEGSRNNVFIEMDGRLYTPPVSSGLLPGVLRKKLIQKKICIERIIMREDMHSAQRVYCGNSVRGLRQIKIIEE